MRFKMTLAVAVAALALAVACGGGEEKAPPPSATPETPPVTSSGSVAPDVFMTFEGREYRAQDVGTDLVSLDEVELAGATEDIDIDHAGPVEVYQLENGPSDALYTFQPGQPFPEDEGGSTPDVWLEWAPVEGQTGDGGSGEPGSGGGAEPAEPGTTPVEPGPGVDEPVAPPSGSGGTASPDDVVSATVVPGPDTTPGNTADPSALAEEARAHLAQRLGVSADAIDVVSVAQEWLPHQSCLNLEPGAACIQIAVDGYRVTLRAEGVEYAYYGYPEGEVYPVP